MAVRKRTGSGGESFFLDRCFLRPTGQDHPGHLGRSRSYRVMLRIIKFDERMLYEARWSDLQITIRAVVCSANASSSYNETTFGVAYTSIVRMHTD